MNNLRLEKIKTEDLLLVLIIAAIILTLFYNFLLFHTMSEIFSIVIAFSLGIIILNTRDICENSYLSFLGTAYFFIAFIDLVHTLSYKGMNIIVNNTANTPTQLWIGARYLEALSLFTAILLINKQIKLKHIFKIYLLVTSLITAAVFLDYFPACFTPETGLTPFKIASEYIIIGIFSLSLYFLARNKEYLGKNTFRLITYSYLLSIIAELSFTLYTDVYDIMNATGHIFKILSFYFLYKAIIENTLTEPYESLFYKLKSSRDKLLKTNEKLTESIRQQKKVEKELQKFSRAVEQNPSTIVITDPDGNIEYVNPKFTEITGYSRGEALGENPRILKSGVQDDELYKELWDTISSGNEWRGELCNEKKNGDLYWEFASISPIFGNEGNITHYIGIKEDITVRKRMEEKLKRAKREAERANQAKSDFLAKIIHEIRTPMNGIIGLSELMLAMDLNRKHRHYLKMINNSANLLLDIINDILDLSKIEAGKMELEEREFNLQKLVEDTLQTFAIKAHKKCLGLNYYINPEVPDYIKGDPARLRQIIINLIGNAIKYTENGEIYLEVKKSRQNSGRNSLRKLNFSVTDTGIGIPVNRQDNLFQSFSRVNEHRETESGTGLGLAISRQLVEMMGGEINVVSYPGIGSTFYFDIEVNKVHGDGDTGYRDAFTGENIEAYLVEFNYFRRKRLARLLTYWGIQVQMPETPAEIPELSNTGDLLIVNTFIQPSLRTQLWTGIKNNLELAEKTILLQNTSGCKFSPEDSREIFGAVIFKPESREILYRAVESIVKGKRRTVQPGNNRQRKQPPEQTAKKTTGTAPAQLSILVAEDNLINQELTVTLLENRGWRATTAENGKKALTLLEEKNNHFDLILMDIQMPIMGGLEAARIIRRRGIEIPIIALTAGSTDTERKSYRQAGINDYLQKPLRAGDLYNKIESLFTAPDGRGDNQAAQESAPEVTNFTLRKLLDRVGGHKKIARKVVNSVLENYPSLLREIETAIREQDTELLELKAHGLKGAVGNLDLENIYQMCYELEKMGKNGELAEAEDKFTELKRVMDELAEKLRTIDWENVTTG